MDPGDSTWWWTFALDGIVSGIIGGAVTGLAVWLTLRHERQTALEVEFRAALSAMQTAAFTLSAMPLHQPDFDWWTPVNDLVGVVAGAAMRVPKAGEGRTNLLRDFKVILERSSS